jgi:hypothetical protein
VVASSKDIKSKVVVSAPVSKSVPGRPVSDVVAKKATAVVDKSAAKKARFVSLLNQQFF